MNAGLLLINIRDGADKMEAWARVFSNMAYGIMVEHWYKRFGYIVKRGFLLAPI